MSEIEKQLQRANQIKSNRKEKKRKEKKTQKMIKNNK